MNEVSTTTLVEARIALHLAMHGKMAESTCLMKCLRSCITNKEVQSARLARTKCTAVVKNVLAPMCKNMLCNQISGPFSIFVDEATDKAGRMGYFGKH